VEELLKIGIFAGIIALGLLAAPAMAQEAAGISLYPASYFDASHPATAADMIKRLPGFTLDTGNSQRGFAGTAGNVLIDGTRPTAKTDDLNTILARIPASGVDRIELIRGGAPGIDMQGQNVVANIVRKAGASNQTILTLANTWIEDGEWVPQARLEFHGTAGKTNYELALERTVNVSDDSPGFGYRSLLNPATGAKTFDTARSYGIMALGWSGHGAVTAPLLGGDWNNNLTLQTQDNSNGIAYSGSGGSRFDNTQRTRNGEFGSHWQGLVGPVTLETLILQRLGDERDFNTSAAPGDVQDFTAHYNSGESIGRVTARYPILPELNLEAGGEAAYNFLDGHTGFTDNGAAVALPNANVSVNEKRGELFAQGTWTINPRWTLEAGARLEYSTISESGDTNLSRNFFYIKPRALLTWSPDADDQVRLRVEKKLGQLDFNNFVASSNLSSFGVAGGNANLRPDQRWQFEGAYERRFLGRGSLVATYLHEDIKDLQDYIPIGGGLDAPGNLPHATDDEISLGGQIPLDWLGLPNSLLKPTANYWWSSVIDPVTGAERHISNLRDYRVSLELTQDVIAWNSTWGIGWLPADGSNASYRIANISTVRIHVPYLWAYWVYSPTPDWSLKLEGDNIVPYRFELEQDIYGGPRNTSGLQTLQDVFLRTRPRIFFQIRKTF
jgi:outer membrane receptor protein involved in Fe transport